MTTEPAANPRSNRPMPSRRMGAMVSVRLTEEEHEAVRRSAEEAGLSVSSYLRQAAMTAATHGSGGLQATVTTTHGAMTWISDTQATTQEVYIPTSLTQSP